MSELMSEKTVKRRLQDAGDAALASDDDATVVAKLIDALNRAIPTSHDLELKTEALRVGQETAPRETNPRKVAYHEAGHAVVARNFGLTVMRVSIDPAYGELFDGQPREGYTRLERDADRHASLQQRLWIALSGPAAQKRHDPDGLGGLVCTRADYECARRLYAELRGKGDSKAEDLVSDERKARALVTRHWSAIEAVALALVEHPRHSLNGKELDALLLAQRRN
jgi:hypothetical protein